MHLDSFLSSGQGSHAGPLHGVSLVLGNHQCPVHTYLPTRLGLVAWGKHLMFSLYLRAPEGLHSTTWPQQQSACNSFLSIMHVNIADAGKLPAQGLQGIEEGRFGALFSLTLPCLFSTVFFLLKHALHNSPIVRSSKISHTNENIL